MRPLDDADFAQVATLLHEGFPGLSAGFWAAALQRLKHYGGNRQAGVPLGWLMLNGTEPVGVMLTPASLRLRPDGRTERIVNLSSWYVRPEFRWRAGFMLRGAMVDKTVVYTDLTPSPEVQKMLPLFGFQPLNRGVALHLLPLQCLHPSRGAQIRDLQPDEPWAHAGPPREMIEAHRELGCLPLVLQPPLGPPQLVICRLGRLRGLRLAQLVYADSQSLLLRHRGALARYLLKKGVMLFVHDTRQSGSTPTAWYRPRDQWFACGHAFDDRTDAFASELCIVHAHLAHASGPAQARQAGAAC
jgi:hypothetical protein